MSLRVRVCEWHLRQTPQRRRTKSRRWYSAKDLVFDPLITYASTAAKG